MIRQLLINSLLLIVLLSLTACAKPTMYYWGNYEDSLYERSLNTSGSGQTTRSFELLESTIEMAEKKQARVPPGVYADYGYTLFKSGRTDEAIEALKKERELFPESKKLMDSMISRIQARGK